MDRREYIPSENRLEYQIQWLIRLRWLAWGLAAMAVVAAWQISRGTLPAGWLAGGLLMLLVSNTAYHFFWNYCHRLSDTSQRLRYAGRFANIQIQIDFLLLTYFLHFSGGPENPFVSYYIFHTVIASILLSRRAAYLQALSATFYAAFLHFGPGLFSLRQFHFSGFTPFAAIGSWGSLYSLGQLAAQASALLLTVYLTTSVVRRLRDHDAALHDANRRLQEQDMLKSRYVATVSHDLQSSLSAIQSCLCVVTAGYTGSLPEKALEMVERAENRSRQMLVFVKDLLSLSNMRASEKLKRQAVPIRSIYNDVLALLQSDLLNKEMRINDTGLADLKLMVNRELAAHVLLNLLSNAIRYTPRRGAISIAAESAAHNGFARIVVQDSGIGIPADALPFIFDDFYRGENALIMEKNGTGLGLAIVRQVALQHGGDAWAESRLGEGASFYVLLPMAEGA